MNLKFFKFWIIFWIILAIVVLGHNTTSSSEKSMTVKEFEKAPSNTTEEESTFEAGDSSNLSKDRVNATPTYTRYLDNSWVNQELKDPLPGEVIPPGFGYIVPDEYRNGNQSSVSALWLGAQMVASRAVSKGLFTNSVHNITKVYSSNITHLPSLEDEDYLLGYEEVVIEVVNENGEVETTYDYVPNKMDKGYYRYDYDVELASSYGEKLRAQFTTMIGVYNKFKVSNFSFAYDALINGEKKRVKLTGQAISEGYRYDLLEASSDDTPTKVITEDSLPAWGQGGGIGELLGKGWVQVDPYNDDIYIQFLIEIGGIYADYQLQQIPDVRALSGESEPVFAWKKQIDKNKILYFFMTESYENDGMSALTTHQLSFNPVEKTFYIYSWAGLNYYSGPFIWSIILDSEFTN